jgi:hypothetical protein
MTRRIVSETKPELRDRVRDFIYDHTKEHDDAYGWTFSAKEVDELIEIVRDTDRGEGIGELISPEEGKARLNAYAEWCAKPTEGPWQRMNGYDGYLTIIGNVDGETHPDGQETYSYDFICNCEDAYGEATSPANVKLILAAPELFAACYRAYQRIDGEVYPELIEPLHAALVKALGKHPEKSA